MGLQTVYLPHTGASTASGTLVRIVRCTALRTFPAATSLLLISPLSRLMRVLLLAALVVLALGAAGQAAAAPGCAKNVIDDWYDDGRVDGTYPAHCYDDAIDALPRDVRDYSSAKEDIQRALQAMLSGGKPPPARIDPSPEVPAPEDFDGDGIPNERDSTPGTRPGDPGDDTQAVGDIDTAASDSVPVPLLVLAGLALLLVAAGSVGYLVRRLQARRVSPPTA